MEIILNRIQIHLRRCLSKTNSNQLINTIAYNKLYQINIWLGPQPLYRCCSITLYFPQKLCSCSSHHLSCNWRCVKKNERYCQRV